MEMFTIDRSVAAEIAAGLAAFVASAAYVLLATACFATIGG